MGLKYDVVPFLFIRCSSFLLAQGATAHVEASGWLPGQPKEAEVIEKCSRFAREVNQLIKIVIRALNRNVVFLMEMQLATRENAASSIG